MVARKNPEGGRPTSFKPEYVELVKCYCEIGLTDQEICEVLCISLPTFYRWQHSNPDFKDAIRVGKGQADTRVERTIYNQAVGFYYTEDVLVKLRGDDGKDFYETVQVKKYKQPDTKAMQFWLKNRKKAEWREQYNHTVSDMEGNEINPLKINIMTPTRHEDRVVKPAYVEPSTEAKKEELPAIGEILKVAMILQREAPHLVQDLSQLDEPELKIWYDQNKEKIKSVLGKK
ncbi:MAG: hypothetical protein JSC085_000989 [Candidatus Tokpelaia sp. JSC085]|nr:MAG: hypothetical protein JSC085_000989 [Candidatus Tokpelaia sp. JSC085]